jgi:hypothetical protein
MKGLTNNWVSKRNKLEAHEIQDWRLGPYMMFHMEPNKKEPIVKNQIILME